MRCKCDMAHADAVCAALFQQPSCAEFRERGGGTFALAEVSVCHDDGHAMMGIGGF